MSCGAGARGRHPARHHPAACGVRRRRQPVDLYDFLGDVLARLGLPAPKAPLPFGVAMRLAGVLESVSKHVLGWREPPLTRFGVAVFSQSKTFDIGKAVAAFGPPPVRTGVAVDRFVAWLQDEDDAEGRRVAEMLAAGRATRPWSSPSLRCYSRRMELSL